MSAYIAPKHLAIVRTGKLAGDREVAFWVEAVRTQLRDHAAPAWGLPAPGVFLYDADTFVPADGGVVIAIVDDDGNDDAAGFHSALGDVPFALVDLHQSAIPSRTLSHEALEIWGNAMLDRWVPNPNGLEYAVELGDPVQRSGYTIDVNMFGDTAPVVVSDFVTPQWFGLGDKLSFPGGCNFLRTIDTAFTIASDGYAIARRGNGELVFLAPPDGAFMNPGKARKFSRTRRLIACGGK